MGSGVCSKHRCAAKHGKPARLSLAVPDRKCWAPQWHMAAPTHPSVKAIHTYEGLALASTAPRGRSGGYETGVADASAGSRWCCTGLVDPAAPFEQHGRGTHEYRLAHPSPIFMDRNRSHRPLRSSGMPRNAGSGREAGRGHRAAARLSLAVRPI